MKPVYTWPLIYILLFLLPSQLRAHPNDSARFLLEFCIGLPISKTTTFNHAETNTPGPLCPGELVSINGRYGLITRESAPGYFHIITSFKPPTYNCMAQENIVRFEPPLILKPLLMERLSDS